MNLFVTMSPGTTQLNGKISLYLGEGTCQVDLNTPAVVWDTHHPMSEVLRKMCGYTFMEELMQVNRERREKIR